MLDLATRTLASRSIARRALWLALLAALAFGFQGSRPLWEPDEGRYTDIALQMIDSGDWWVPRLNDEQPHLAKPPLTYWAIGASLGLFGRNEWAARLPSGIALLLSALLVRRIAALLAFRRPAFAALVWISSLGPFLGFNFVTTDALLALFETAAVAAFLRSGALTRETPERGWITVMWILYALGFLTKGPPALLPLLAIVVWLTGLRRGLRLRRIVDPVGIVVFTVLAFGWFLSLVAGDSRLLGYFVGFEFLQRIVTDVHHRNPSWTGMLTVYAPTLLIGVLPWLLFAWRAPRRERDGMPSSLTRSGTPLAVASDAARRRFLWAWFSVPMTVFAVAQSRLPLYVLPSFVPLCLLIAGRIETANRGFERITAFSVAWIIVLIGGRAAIAHVTTAGDDRAIARQVAGLVSAMSRPIDEIVFVDAKPLYGLRFYAGVPVERVATIAATADPNALFEPESACEEAQHHEHPLWLVARSSASRFDAALQQCGYRAQSLPGVVQDWQAFEVTPTARRPEALHVARAAGAATRAVNFGRVSRAPSRR